MTNKPSVTIMFPFLNDWGTVGSLVALAITTIQKYTDDWEVVIVNDGSTKENSDALEKIVETINQKSPRRWPAYKDSPGVEESRKRIKIITHAKNRGYGGALRNGFAKATKDFIFYTDCDAQYDPRELTLLMERMKPGI